MLLATGSFRTEGGTADCGRSAATISSTSRLHLCRAAASTRSWLSAVRCGASRPIAVRCSAPSASSSRMRGHFRAARAASMRRYGVFGQVQDLGAVGEERGAAFAEIQPPRIQFTECRISRAVACRSNAVSRVTSLSSSASDSRVSFEIYSSCSFNIVVWTQRRCAPLRRLTGDPAAMLVVTEKSAPARDKAAEAPFVERVGSEGTKARTTCQAFSQ